VPQKQDKGWWNVTQLTCTYSCPTRHRTDIVKTQTAVTRHRNKHKLHTSKCLQFGSAQTASWHFCVEMLRVCHGRNRAAAEVDAKSKIRESASVYWLLAGWRWVQRTSSAGRPRSLTTSHRRRSKHAEHLPTTHCKRSASAHAVASSSGLHAVSDQPPSCSTPGPVSTWMSLDA